MLRRPSRESDRGDVSVDALFVTGQGCSTRPQLQQSNNDIINRPLALDWTRYSSEEDFVSPIWNLRNATEKEKELVLHSGC